MPRPNVQLIALYQKQARNYDRSGVRGLDTWRREAVRQLHLKRGNLVVDSGCGTSLNFPWLQEAVGPQGNILGGDLTNAMLEEARRRVVQAGWRNVELLQADATSYVFPTRVDGVLSTFAFSFFPEWLPGISARSAVGCVGHGLATHVALVVLLCAVLPARISLWYHRRADQTMSLAACLEHDASVSGRG